MNYDNKNNYMFLSEFMVKNTNNANNREILIISCDYQNTIMNLNQFKVLFQYLQSSYTKPVIILDEFDSIFQDNML